MHTICIPKKYTHRGWFLLVNPILGVCVFQDFEVMWQLSEQFDIKTRVNILGAAIGMHKIKKWGCQTVHLLQSTFQKTCPSNPTQAVTPAPHSALSAVISSFTQDGSEGASAAFLLFFSLAPLVMDMLSLAWSRVASAAFLLFFSLAPLAIDMLSLACPSVTSQSALPFFSFAPLEMDMLSLALDSAEGAPNFFFFFFFLPPILRAAAAEARR